MSRLLSAFSCAIAIGIVILLVALSLDYYIPPYTSGSLVLVKATKQEVLFIAINMRSSPRTLLCRVDHGAMATPRYTEITYAEQEIEPIPALQSR